MSLKIKTQNLNGFNRGSVVHRDTESIVNSLTNGRPAILAVQELGDSYSGDVNENYLLKRLAERGYGFIPSAEPVRTAVNAGIFFDSKVLTFVQKLKPVFTEGFFNRQAGALLRDQEGRDLYVYSFHLPLVSAWPQEKADFWDSLIELAKASTTKRLIIAGDFNETQQADHPTDLAYKLAEIGQYMKFADDPQASWENKQLDHIFVHGSDIKVLDTATAPKDTSVSDHCAKTALLEVA